MAEVSVKFNSNIKAVKDAYGIKANNAANAATNDLLSGSLPKTPRKRGELRTNRRKIVQGLGKFQAVWQSNHAAVQEAGRRRGARPFRRYTTAGTGAHFVADKIADIKANFKSRYWK